MEVVKAESGAEHSWSPQVLFLMSPLSPGQEGGSPLSLKRGCSTSFGACPTIGPRDHPQMSPLYPPHLRCSSLKVCHESEWGRG